MKTRLIGYCGVRDGAIDPADIITVDPPTAANVQRVFPKGKLTDLFPKGYARVMGKFIGARLVSVCVAIATNLALMVHIVLTGFAGYD